MHMGSGFCLCAGLAAAEGLRIAAVGGGVPGPGMPGPYRGIHDSHALASACATFSTSSSFRAEYPATTVSARQRSGRAR